MPVRVLEANGIRVRIAPVEEPESALAAGPGRVLEGQAVRTTLGGARHRLLSLDIGDADGDGPPTFDATIYDYDNRRTLLASGPVDDPASAEVATSGRQPPPDDDEFDEAVAALRAHGQVGAAIASGSLVPYHAMPPLLNVTRPDGTVERAVNVGLHTRGDGAVEHRRCAKPGVMSCDDEPWPQRRR